MLTVIVSRIALVGLAAVMFACATGGGPSTRSGSPSMATQTKRSNEEVVRAVYEVSLNTGDMDLLDRSVAPDFVGPLGDKGPSALRPGPPRAE